MLKFLLTILCLISSQVLGDDSDVGLNTVEMIENHGYVAENHYITTEDGYILTYQRIPHGKNDNSTIQRPAILLMHGLSSSSADYVNMDNRSLSYMLADIGYDVWIANARGNAWSRNHTTFDVVKDVAKFYNFSWHEIGYYDLPAAIDYILALTGNEQLYYVGHSQGGTSFLVMGATRPEYNDKIKLAALMAPASLMEYHPNDILKIVSQYIYELAAIFQDLQIYELPYPELLREFLSAFCTQPEYLGLCEVVLFEFIGADYEQFDPSILPVALTNLPSNFGLKQVIHYGQLIKNGGFSQFDYGTEGNLIQYGTETPPAYEWDKITAPIALYYGKNDALVNYKDVQNIEGKLPNVVRDYLVPFDNFNHFDFIIAIDVVDLVYVDLIKTLSQY